MFSSDRLRYWLAYAQQNAVPERIPRTGKAGAAVRGVSVTLTLDDEKLHFVKVEGDRVHCLGLDGDGHFSVEQIISIYDAWRADPKIEDYWGLVSFRFDSWRRFAIERRFHLERIKFLSRRLRRSVRARVGSFRKRVAVQRHSILSAVQRMRTVDKVPTSWDVANNFLGNDWTDKSDAFDRLDQIESMLDALVELGELRKNGIGYEVTGLGIATLSQYEEDERKHRESMGLQKGIRWLTFVMMIAALLQAKVIDFKPLLSFKGSWPWE